MQALRAERGSLLSRIEEIKKAFGIRHCGYAVVLSQDRSPARSAIRAPEALARPSSLTTNVAKLGPDGEWPGYSDRLSK